MILTVSSAECYYLSLPSTPLYCSLSIILRDTPAMKIRKHCLQRDDSFESACNYNTQVTWRLYTHAKNICNKSEERAEQKPNPTTDFNAQIQHWMSVGLWKSSGDGMDFSWTNFEKEGKGEERRLQRSQLVCPSCPESLFPAAGCELFLSIPCLTRFHVCSKTLLASCWLLNK